jgi:large subunit ribosomal protein L21
MYAIIEVGAKQYQVQKGDKILVEKFDAPVKGEVSIKEVLLVVDGDDVKIGQPHVKGASVTAVVQRETKGEKTISFKYRRRKASHTTKGHRQQLMELAIKNIAA